MEKTESDAAITTKTVSHLNTYALKDEFIRRGLRFSPPLVSGEKTTYEDFQRTPGILCYVSNFHNPQLYPNVSILKTKLQDYLSSLKLPADKLMYVDWKSRKFPSDAIAHFQTPEDLQEAVASSSMLSETSAASSTGPPPFMLTPLTERQEISYYQELEVRREIASGSQKMVIYRANMLEALMKILVKEETLVRSIQEGAKVGSMCNICRAEFPSRAKLFRHLREHHLQGHNFPSSSNCDRDGNTHDDDPANAYSRESEKTSCEDLNEMPTIVYEDDYVRVIKKPQGLSTQGEKGCHTLHSSDVLTLKPTDSKFYRLSYRKALPCHRLDKLTGGLVLCSKFKEMESFLGYCFSHKCIKKRYRALCPGTIEPASGVIDSPIDGKDSSTRYQVVKVTPSYRFGTITTVDLWPLQGRKHQLRIHLKSIGHAILGDPRYSQQVFATPKENMMCLWALGVQYPDPTIHVATKLTMDTSSSDDMKAMLGKEVSEESKETIAFGDGTEMRKKKTAKTLHEDKNSIKYDCVTLLQGAYKEVELEEPHFFESIRLEQQLVENACI